MSAPENPWAQVEAERAAWVAWLRNEARVSAALSHEHSAWLATMHAARAKLFERLAETAARCGA